MKKQKITAFALLSEELDGEILMNLNGGENADPIRAFPHDLITPTRSAKPYTPSDPDE